MINVVAAILINDNNKILIAKRKKEKNLGGYWEFPGGKVEKGEIPEESLIRELKEEMHVDIKINRYFSSNVHNYGNFKINLIGFIGKIINGKIVLKDHDEYKWVSVEELLGFHLAPADIPFISKLRGIDLMDYVEK